jgi:heme exporter protein C
MTAPSRESDRPRIDWFLAAAVVSMLATFVRIAYFTPVEARQGAAQKIFYLHVPTAFIALYVAFAIVGLTSAMYLWLRDERLDRIAASAAEVGVVYMAVVLLTGPMWAKPIWGTWWTWDARLTLTLFAWFVFLGYLILRGAIEDESTRSRYSAVLGILGTLLVPFIHLSVYLFRTLHPMPILLKPSRPSLPNDMLLTFGMAFVALTLLFVALIRMRYRLAVTLDALESKEAAEEASVGALRPHPIR